MIKKFIFTVFCGIIAFNFISCKLSDNNATKPSAVKKEEIPINITYVSSKKEELKAAYYPESEKVKVTMADGRVFEMPQTLSASGVRYSQDDGTVFWSKGNSVLFYLNDKLVFEGSEKPEESAKAVKQKKNKS